MKWRTATPTWHGAQSDYYSGYWAGYADAWEHATNDGPPAIRPARPPHLRLAASDGTRIVPPCRASAARPPRRYATTLPWLWLAGIVIALALAVIVGAAVAVRGDDRTDPDRADPPAAERPALAPAPPRSHTAPEPARRDRPTMMPEREPRSSSRAARASTSTPSTTLPPSASPSTLPSASPSTPAGSRPSLPDLPILGRAA